MEPAYDNRQRTWTMLCHLSSLIVLLGIPFGNVLGPFIVWLFKKNEFPLVDDQGRESINFQISMTVYALVALALAISLTPVLIGIVFYPVAGVIVAADLVLVLVAAVRASNNIPYRYPLSLRIIR